MEEESKMSLDKLKIEYGKIQSKFNLPSFDEMNKEFWIDKLSDTETDFLVREVRRMMGDKLANYMRFVEGLLHPTNNSIFIFSLLKALDEGQKKALGEIYKEMMKNEMEFIICDLEFSEENEANFVKNAFELWKKIQKRLIQILKSADKNWDKKIETDSKGYFG